MLEEKSPFCLVQNPTLLRGEGGYLKSDAAFPTLLPRIVVCSVVGAVEVNRRTFSNIDLVFLFKWVIRCGKYLKLSFPFAKLH